MFEEFRDLPAGAIPPDHCMRVLNAIEYRASCMSLAEIAARLFSLDRPDGKDVSILV